MKQQTLWQCLSRKRVRAPAQTGRDDLSPVPKLPRIHSPDGSNQNTSVPLRVRVRLKPAASPTPLRLRVKNCKEPLAPPKNESPSKAILSAQEEKADASALTPSCPLRRSRRIRQIVNDFRRPIYTEPTVLDDIILPPVRKPPVKSVERPPSPLPLCTPAVRPGRSLNALLRHAELGGALSVGDLLEGSASLLVSRERQAPALVGDALYQNAGGLLQKVYALALHGAGGGRLVAAGGRGGIVAVLPVPASAEPVDAFAYEPAAAVGVSPVWALALHARWVSDVQFAFGGRAVVSAGDDGAVHVARAADGRVEATLRDAGASIYSMHAGGPSGEIACAAKDGRVALCRVARGTVLRERCFAAHTGVAKCVRWRPRSPLVATCGNDRAVRLFDARQFAPAPALEIADAHAGAVNSVLFHPADENVLASAGFDGFLQVFDARRMHAPLVRTRAHQGHRSKRVGGLFHPTFFNDGETIVTAGDRAAAITQFATRTGNVVATFPISSAPPTVIAADNDTRTLVFPVGSGKLCVLRPPSRHAVWVH